MTYRLPPADPGADFGTGETILEAISNGRIFHIEPCGVGFKLKERCDEYFSLFLTAPQLYQLGTELRELAKIQLASKETTAMTDYKQLCAELVEKLDELNCHYNVPNQSAIVERARTELAKPEPERLTVQEISDLPQHGENYIAEHRDGEIQLDGDFSRADLQQLADSIPNTND